MRGERLSAGLPITIHWLTILMLRQEIFNAQLSAERAINEQQAENWPLLNQFIANSATLVRSDLCTRRLSPRAAAWTA